MEVGRARGVAAFKMCWLWWLLMEAGEGGGGGYYSRVWMCCRGEGIKSHRYLHYHGS